MKIRIKSCPSANNGLQVEGDQYTPISDSMVMLGGKSHSQGGTDIAFNGQKVEAEAGEPVSIGDKGEAIVWGNMNVPGTRKKFKGAAKQIGEEEAKNDKNGARAEVLLAENDPESKWERLGFNSGRVMQLGALYGQKEINDTKSKLSSLQQALLETAHENNLDPQSLSKGKFKKAKKGAFLEYGGMLAADGTNLGEDPKKKTRSDRNNNPGNVKFGDFAKKMGATGQDPDGFAIFPDVNTGQAAMTNLLTGKSYKNLPVKDAISKWTAGKPYDLSGLGDLQGRRVGDLDPTQLGIVLNYMKKGEGTNYGGPSAAIPAIGTTPNYTPSPYIYQQGKLPQVDLTSDPAIPIPEQVSGNTPFGDIPGARRGPMPSNVQALNLAQIAPELYGFATNKEVPVALQKYNPQMYVPYQMSFQDQINDNQANFNQLTRRVDENPALASSIGAQMYDANNRVRANEFRTNQGIQADTINKNIGLMNDAQLKNLQLADTQFVRQSEAKSRTREINNAIMNSITSKYQQNDLNNKRLAAFENLYDYRFNDTNHDRIPDQATYFGPDASFNNFQVNGTQPGQTQGNNPYSRTVVQSTQNGVTQRTITPSQQDIQYKDLNIQKKQQDIYPRKSLLKRLFGK